MNSRRISEAQKKTPNYKDTSSKVSTSCNRSRPRNKEEAGTEEHLGGRGEDLDQEQGEIEIVAEKRGSEEIEDRREPLQADHFLDTFRRSLESRKKDLTDYTDQLGKAPQSKRLMELITQDREDIRALEDSVRRVQGGRF